jgi:hypothetical protein
MKKWVMTGIMTGVVISGISGHAMADWTEDVKIGGDARFRYQNTDQDGSEARERWRVRGRINVKGRVNDMTKVTLRLVTNTGDPISDNQTMDNAFEDKDTRFDRIMITHTPAEGLDLIIGKMSQPWTAVADLIMAGDVNPEGLAANYAFGSDAVDVKFHGGAFVIDERSRDDETMLYTGQAGVKFNLGEETYLMLGGSVYSYDNVKGTGLQVDEEDSFGNTTVADADGNLTYASEYMITEGFVQAGFDAGVPVTIGGQYIVNTDAETSEDTGYLLMAKTKVKGVEFGYQYRYLEADAAFGAFAESTDTGNGTDVEGHIPYVKFKLNDSISVKTQYAMCDNGLDNGKNRDTLKIDLVAKF